MGCNSGTHFGEHNSRAHYGNEFLEHILRNIIWERNTGTHFGNAFYSAMHRGNAHFGNGYLGNAILKSAFLERILAGTFFQDTGTNIWECILGTYLGTHFEKLVYLGTQNENALWARSQCPAHIAFLIFNVEVHLF